jgi:hypothetical protein
MKNSICLINILIECRLTAAKNKWTTEAEILLSKYFFFKHESKLASVYP